MVNLNLNYDKTLHQKTFILKGEEAYARTTDTLLKIHKFNNSTSEFGYVRLGVEIDVLRETGDDSIVILYNGDTILKTYNWSAGQSNIVDGDSNDTNGIKLAYGVEHNLYAVYMGNKQCLKSQSKTVSFTEPIPASANTKLTISTYANYNNGVNVVCPVTLGFAELNTVSNVLFGQTIKYYVDDVYYDSATASNSSRTATCTITGLSEGLHTIKAVFEGSDYLYGCEGTVEIGVGYNIEVLEYNPVMVYDDSNNQIKVKVTDIYGDVASGVLVSLSDEWVNTQTATTNSEGIATFTSTDGYKAFTITYGGSSTNEIECGLLKINTLEFNRDTLDIVAGKTGSFEVRIGNATWYNEVDTLKDIPIVLTGGITGTYYTNDGGIVTVPYDDTITSNITATVGGVSKTLPVERLLQYWVANTSQNNWNKNAETQYATLKEYRNGFLLAPVNQNHYGRLIIYAPITETISCSFDVVGVGKSGKITVAGITTDVAMGDKVKIIFDSSNSTRTLKVNNETINTSSTSSMLDIKINEGLSGSPRSMDNYITFNNLRVQYEVIE